jgi:hypothetical protein
MLPQHGEPPLCCLSAVLLLLPLLTWQPLSFNTRRLPASCCRAGSPRSPTPLTLKSSTCQQQEQQTPRHKQQGQQALIRPGRSIVRPIRVH